MGKKKRNRQIDQAAISQAAKDNLTEQFAATPEETDLRFQGDPNYSGTSSDTSGN